MRHFVLPLAALAFLAGATIATAQQKPEYYILAMNASPQHLRIEVRAGSTHFLSLDPQNTGQIIFRASGTYASASYQCDRVRHGVGLHLNAKEPTIHLTISHDCRASVRYGPEPKG